MIKKNNSDLRKNGKKLYHGIKEPVEVTEDVSELYTAIRSKTTKWLKS